MSSPWTPATPLTPPSSSTLIWYPDKKYEWLLGTIQSEDCTSGPPGSPSQIAVRPIESNPDEKEVRYFSRSECHKFDPSHIEGRADDLAKLNSLTVAPLLDCLRRRFFKLLPYTYIADIVIAVNPYKRYPHITTLPQPLVPYTEEMIPHVWATADFSYRAMMTSLRDIEQTNEKQTDENFSGMAVTDQCVIISGESGSGKTVTSNNVMMYLTQLSSQGNRRMVQMRGRASSVAQMNVEMKILACNPFLEAFGNAETTRNKNSSRFGRYTVLQFNKGRLIGAKMKDYLLEKNRVTKQIPGNRNYHIFYYLIHGADPELRSTLELRTSPSSYNYLNGGGDKITHNVVDDADKFRSVCRCLGIADVPEEEQLVVWKILTAILELGQITFKMGPDDTVVFENNESTSALARCAKHFGFTIGSNDETSFDFLLLHRIRIVGAKEEKIIEPYTNMIDAVAARDSFAKELYARVFKYVVNVVNSSLEAPDDIIYDGTVGILDIFGFEKFETNSFEQLLINYTNEVLQNLFNEYVFRNESALYKREGIASVAAVAYADNIPVCRLIDAQYTRHRFHGILSILDDATKAPANRNLTDADFASDVRTSFMIKIKSQASSSASYVHFFDPSAKKNKNLETLKRRRYNGKKFWIEHYAGHVRYDTKGFVAKNRDRTPPFLISLLDNSAELFVKMFLSDAAMRRMTLSRNSTISTIVATKKERRRPSLVSATKRSSRKTVHATIASSFTSALRSLSKTLRKCNPHYVRCIKPNRNELDASAHWDAFDAPMVLDQLIKSGVLETVKTRQRGFPFRMKYRKLRKKLSFLRVPHMMERDVYASFRHHKSDREWCARVLESASGEKLSSGNHAVLKQKSYDSSSLYRRTWIQGKTMMFGKSHLLDVVMKWARMRSAKRLVPWMRRAAMRHKLRTMIRDGVMPLQTRWRRVLRRRASMHILRIVTRAINAKEELSKLRMYVSQIVRIQRWRRFEETRKIWARASQELSARALKRMKEKERERALMLRRKREEEQRRAEDARRKKEEMKRREEAEARRLQEEEADRQFEENHARRKAKRIEAAAQKSKRASVNVRMRLSSLKDAELGLARTFSSKDVDATSSPVLDDDNDVPSSTNKSRKQISRQRSNESQSGWSAPMPRQRHEESRAERAERKRRWGMEAKRRMRLETTIKRFAEVDGIVAEKENVELEQKFGVDNRACFDCLKTDKMGVRRSRQLIVDRSLGGALENIRKGNQNSTRKSIELDRISSATISSKVRTDVVVSFLSGSHPSNDSRSRTNRVASYQRPYKLRFANASDAAIFCKTLEYAMSASRRRKTRALPGKMQGKAKPRIVSSLDVGHTPKAEMGGSNRTSRGVSNTVRTSFVARDADSSSRCRIHFRPEISNLMGLGLAMSREEGKRDTQRYEMVLKNVAAKTIRLSFRRSTPDAERVINVDTILQCKKDRSNVDRVILYFGAPWYTSAAEAIKIRHAGRVPSMTLVFDSERDRDAFCVTMLWSKQINRECYRATRRTAMRNAILGDAVVGRVWYVGFNSNGKWQPHILVWRMNNASSSVSGTASIVRERTNGTRETVLKFDTSAISKLARLNPTYLPQRSTMPLDARPVVIVVRARRGRQDERGRNRRERNCGVVFGNHAEILDFIKWVRYVLSLSLSLAHFVGLVARTRQHLPIHARCKLCVQKLLLAR